ncbi:MAG: hypothetical protein HYY00_09090 [Chloroflexi bacterium]|nr:hypothetical protein [Chloroflexota bacterium]
MTFPHAIATIVESIALPHGYTLAIWSAGALAVFGYRVLHVRDVFLFVIGAVTGFLIFALPTWRSVASSSTISISLPSIALLNIFPLAAAVASSLVTRRIGKREVGYFVTGMTATVVYILSLSLLIALVGR